MLGIRTVSAATVLTFGAVSLGYVRSADSQSSSVTFTRDIAPILQRSCQNCHSPLGLGPMPLTTYAEVRPWARAIKQRTATREMPPWFIEKNIGIQRFRNDPSLTDGEIETIAHWVDNGAPKGDERDLPPPRVFESGREWTIGQPDLVISSPEVTVHATAPDVFGELPPVPTGLAEDRYVAAVEVREVKPGTAVRSAWGDPKKTAWVFHHAAISSDDSGGFSTLYNLGRLPEVYRGDSGQLLKAGSELRFLVHLHSIGLEVSEAKLLVGIKFHQKGYIPKYVHERTSMGGVYDLDIPPGEADVRFDGFHVLDMPAIMTTFEPHMHSRGKRMCVEAIYGNAGREMLNCAGYDQNWIRSYEYEENAAPLLPAGTILHITAWYDNSKANRSNIEPRNWAGWGERGIDDMFFFQPLMVYLTDEQFMDELSKRNAAIRQSPREGVTEP